MTEHFLKPKQQKTYKSIDTKTQNSQNTELSENQVSPYSRTISNFDNHIDKLKQKSSRKEIVQGRMRTGEDLESSHQMSSDQIDSLQKLQSRQFDLILKYEDYFTHLNSEMKEIKGSIKQYNLNLKKMDTLFDQVQGIHTILGAQNNIKPLSSNNASVKDNSASPTEIVKKQLDKFHIKLTEINSDVKNIDSNLYAMKQSIEDKLSNLLEVNNSKSGTKQITNDTENKNNSAELKILKSINNNILKHLGSGYTESESIPIKLHRIELKVESFESNFTEKTARLEKINDSLNQNLSSISKFIKESRAELDVYKNLLKDNKDRLSQEVIKNIEIQILKNSENILKIFSESEKIQEKIINIENSVKLIPGEIQLDQDRMDNNKDEIKESVKLSNNEILKLIKDNYHSTIESINTNTNNTVCDNLNVKFDLIKGDIENISSILIKNEETITKNIESIDGIKVSLSNEKLESSIQSIVDSISNYNQEVLTMFEKTNNLLIDTYKNVGTGFKDIDSKLEAQNKVRNDNTEEFRIQYKETSKQLRDTQQNTLKLDKIQVSTDKNSSDLSTKIENLSVRLNSLKK